MTKHFKDDGDTILLIGKTKGELGSSLYLREIEGREEGAPPTVDLALERKNGDFVRGQIQNKNISACHDISDGGLFIALAEMAMASKMGMDISLNTGDVPIHAYGFGEDQARYVISASPETANDIVDAASAAGVEIETICNVSGTALDVQNAFTISVDELLDAHAMWMPNYMSNEA